MINFKEELLKHIENRTIKCAKIIDERHHLQKYRIIILPVNYSKDMFEVFLKKIDFKYLGIGVQEIYGTIWYDDGTWSDRTSEDDHEYWKHYKYPEIPEDLIKNS